MTGAAAAKNQRKTTKKKKNRKKRKKTRKGLTVGKMKHNKSAADEKVASLRHKEPAQ